MKWFLISMIIFSLFRFKENIGRPSGTKLLTVSPLQPSLEKYPEFDSMQNLWSSEIGEMNRSFKSADNYFNFFNFYAEVHESTWERKAKKKNGDTSIDIQKNQCRIRRICRISLLNRSTQQNKVFKPR